MPRNLFLKLKWFKKKLKWNYKYRKGVWDYMGEEQLRYDTIVDFIRQTQIDKPEILDLGCGYGALNKYLTEGDYSFSLGVDISSTAIQMAKKQQYPNADFLAINIHNFTPAQKFDIIIFNEVLYYLDNQLEVVSKFSKYFNSGGYFIFSFYGIREDLIEELEKRYTLVKKEIISQSDSIVWGISLYKVGENQ